jgi:hypothetical protein
MGLATRRTRAWLELPGQLARCGTPQTLAQLSLQYWQTAAKDYGDAAGRLAAVAGALVVPGANGAWTRPAPSRDYITFAEPKADAEDGPRRDRRAA